MEGTKGHQRRLQRHVTGPTQRIVVIVPPRLAPLCRMELDRLGMPPGEITEAGIVFEGKLRDAYKVNLHSRIASRVACIMETFRAGTREEMFYKISRHPWELWLNPRHPLKVWVRVEHSRVSHEGQVRDAVVEGIQRRFVDRGLSRPALYGEEQAIEEAQRLWVHLIDNHCTLSLDTTGPHLHERGYRQVHSGAPLRETLAAAILLKSQWAGDVPLVDGMCGSGTFAIEGALLARRIPPGLQRSFLFGKWPSFQEKTWNHLCKTGRDGVQASCEAPIIALDMDSEAVAVTGHNAVRAGVADHLHLENMDFFRFDPADFNLNPGLVVLNPPYGKRIKKSDGSLYRRIGRHLQNVFQGWRFAVAAPDGNAVEQLKPLSGELWPLSHGGLKVLVVLGRVAKPAQP